MKQLDKLTLLRIFGESILKHFTWLPTGYFMRSIASYQYAFDQDTKPVLILCLNRHEPYTPSAAKYDQTYKTISAVTLRITERNSWN